MLLFVVCRQRAADNSDVVLDMLGISQADDGGEYFVAAGESSILCNVFYRAWSGFSVPSPRGYL